MIELLRRRGLLREQMYQVSESRSTWLPTYDFDILVMYRILSLYAFMQEYGALNYINIHTGVAPYVLPQRALDLVRTRFTALLGTQELGFYSKWQDCKVDLRHDRDYAQQYRVVEAWIGLRTAKRLLRSVFGCEFGVVGVPRLLLDVCYHPSMALWREDIASTFRVEFLTDQVQHARITTTVTHDAMLTPNTFVHRARLVLGRGKLLSLRVTHRGDKVYRDIRVDVKNGHAHVLSPTGHQVFSVDCTGVDQWMDTKRAERAREQ